MEHDKISQILLNTMQNDSDLDVQAAAASALQSLLPKLNYSNSKCKEIEETIAKYQRAYIIHQQALRDQDPGC